MQKRPFQRAFSFENSSFNQSSLEESSFTKSSFRTSSLEESSLEQSSFEEHTFDKSSFDQHSFTACSFEKSSFEESRFGTSSFDKQSFTKSSLAQSSLKPNSFEDSSSEDSSFQEDSLDRASFQRTALTTELAQLQRRTLTTELAELERRPLTTELAELDSTALHTELAQLGETALRKAASSLELHTAHFSFERSFTLFPCGGKRQTASPQGGVVRGELLTPSLTLTSLTLVLCHLGSSLPGASSRKRAFSLSSFSKNRFFADFYFWAAGFFCGFSRRIFLPHLVGKSAQKNPPGNPRQNPPKFMQQKCPTHFCRGAGPKKRSDFAASNKVLIVKRSLAGLECRHLL